MRRLKKPAYHPWEYVVRNFPESRTHAAMLGSRLSAEGEQEWELVAFDFESGTAIFKRRKEIHNR